MTRDQAHILIVVGCTCLILFTLTYIGGLWILKLALINAVIWCTYYGARFLFQRRRARE